MQFANPGGADIAANSHLIIGVAEATGVGRGPLDYVVGGSVCTSPYKVDSSLGGIIGVSNSGSRQIRYARLLLDPNRVNRATGSPLMPFRRFGDYPRLILADTFVGPDGGDCALPVSSRDFGVIVGIFHVYGAWVGCVCVSHVSQPIGKVGVTVAAIPRVDAVYLDDTVTIRISTIVEVKIYPQRHQPARGRVIDPGVDSGRGDVRLGTCLLRREGDNE